MDEFGIDPISGIPEDIFSEVVYSFFPTSERGSEDVKMKDTPIMKQAPGVEFIDSGSKSENMMIPQLLHREDTWRIVLISDFDRMINISKHISEHFSQLSFETDKEKPVFGRMKHFSSHFKESKFSYLSSAAIKEDFENIFVKAVSELNRSEIKFSFQKEYGSSALAFFMKHLNEPESWPNDTLFCVKVKLDNKIKLTFLDRLKSKKWPLNFGLNMEKLLREEVYVIPKPDPNSVAGDLRWRLSFSVLEAELTRSLTDIQRRCYRLLKAIVKLDINEELPETKKFPSYYLKTSMLWLCENSCEDSWTIHNLGRQWLTLVDNVLESLEKKELPHYFVSSYNLFCDKPVGIINCWKKKFKQIRQKPLEAFIRFWSKYKIEVGFFDWGMGFNECLNSLISTHSKYANTAIHESQQLQKYQDEVEEISFLLQYFHAALLLSDYCLFDFLTFLKLHPSLNEWLGMPDAQSDEHAIWIYYTVIWGEEVLQLSPGMPSLWSQLAEITHLIVLKYKDQVPDMDLFSTKTAEHFHMIAGSFQMEETVPYINTIRYIKYANFLRVEKRYEEALQILVKYCQTHLPYDDCYLSRVTSEIFDISLKLETAVLHETSHSVTYFFYHLLTCCYIEAGVLAEVHIPENRDIFDLNIKQTKPEYFFAVNKITYGCQLILSGKIDQAFNCFASISEDELGMAILPRESIKYPAMLYTLASISSFSGLHIV